MRLLPLLAILLTAWGECQATQFRDEFETREPSWRLTSTSDPPVLIEQQRTEFAGRTGRGELIRLDSSIDNVPVRLEMPLPAARVLDELTLTLAMRSQRPGWTLGLDVVAPAALDPQTGQPLRFTIRGDRYDESGKWSDLSSRTRNDEIRQKLVLLRAQFPALQEFGQLYVDRVTLVGQLPAGATTLHLDDLVFGPVVTPNGGERVTQAAAATAPQVPAVEFRLDRLLVDGQPFFPRMVPYHGEPPELLKELGFNVVWIPDVSDTRLIRRLWEQGLWITATPPRPRDADGNPLRSMDAGLIPFTADVDPVLFWNFGTRIPGVYRADLTQWIEQVEFADRRRARPVAADVAFSEQHFSREIQMLGISRHPLQSTMSLDDYRLWLQDRRSLARPGTFCWTWLQTEPAPAVMEALREASRPPHIEPEQIRLQAFAAIAGGCRGLGFWTSTSLAGTAPADVERRLAIQRINLELKLLEPWLATAGGVQQIACKVQLPETTAVGRNLSFGVDTPNALERDAYLRTRTAEARVRKSLDRELTAHVVRTDLGSLILPMWLEGHSQFVPGHNAVSNVTLVIPGSEQAAAVTEFSSLQLRSLRSEPVAGGRRVEIPRVDEIGFLWITSDLTLIERARDRIQSVREQTARTLVELATQKLDRVGQVDQELQSLGPQQPDGPQKIGRAKLRLERASSALQSGDDLSGAQLAGEVLQLLRLLQRDHWDAAVQHLSSPASSPYTLCYQTLPDHWRLMSTFGTGREREVRNLLPSGEFEDFDTLVAERWQNVHRAPESVQTSAALFPTGRQRSRYALRLEARPQPGTTPPMVLDEPCVTVSTPRLPVRAGEILHISGWVKLNGPLVGSRDGLLVFDSILGRSGALRIHEGEQWTRFELLRTVPQTGEMTLSLCLTGLGEVLVDDLQVHPYAPRDHLAGEQPASGIQQTSATRLFDRFPRLPRLNPLSNRNPTPDP